MNSIEERLKTFLEPGKSYGLVVHNIGYAKRIIESLSNWLDITNPERTLILSPENNIGIDEVRRVIEFLEFKSSRGFKTVIVYEADKFTEEAANAFLKTLEEPPQYAMILLVTSRWQVLLPTIRSRLSLIRVPFKVDTNLENEFESLVAFWNYEHLERLKKGDFKVLKDVREIVKSNDELERLVSIKNLLEERLGDKKAILQLASELSVHSDFQLLKIFSKVVAWLYYSSEGFSEDYKLKYIKICDEIQRSKLANFNYALTYYTLLLGLIAERKQIVDVLSETQEEVAENDNT
ncbi:hypothetical protein [Fervidobacterium thailandense]|uniref:Tm0771-like C-terminal domain-containing protein n=1 Tax=Fervidobacterium thailandense TaxID=1008305 RepID=A0A1E3G5B1_9BACT|nr:hypothetical protein [Fervidobacterium thailandense]ODN31419.1 hypothetical protein A4H02_01300 [Fervidobacterium thailandense]